MLCLTQKGSSSFWTIHPGPSRPVAQDAEHFEAGMENPHEPPGISAAKLALEWPPFPRPLNADHVARAAMKAAVPVSHQGLALWIQTVDFKQEINVVL